MVAEAPGTPPATVLIAEDEPLVALFLTDTVEEQGLAAIGPAATPEEALAAAAETPPQIAIVDANLGAKGDGIALAEELQRVHATRIIFLSGDASLSANPAVHALKPLAVLKKPCPPGELEAALRSAGT
ncbi:MAG TPA: response regulator [Aestuariivirgaceae bacterium]|nr:response regulator [Aestuariivirgaceae bacterium]